MKVALWLKAMNETFFLKCLGVFMTEGLLEHLFLLGHRMLEGILVKDCNGGMPAYTWRLYFVCLKSSVGPILGGGCLCVLAAHAGVGEREGLRQDRMCPQGKDRGSP